MKSETFREIPGGICAPQGFAAAGVTAGIKKSMEPDLALIVSRTPCRAAGTFTTNAAKAAPVYFDLKQMHRPLLGIVANSGNANACTGREGLRNCEAMARLARQAVAGSGRPLGEFAVCSTGRIGVQLPMDRIESGIHEAAARLSETDTTAARAIMTTDTFSKEIAVEFSFGGKKVRIGGIAKGAGMIQPGMSPTGKRPALHATMLAFITTDADLPRPTLQNLLNRSIAQSFNRISVDGDMSTNDTVLFLANSQAKHKKATGKDLATFQAALNHLTLKLALMIVRDGEGISKVVTLKVTRAATQREAEWAVRAIGNSTLVKCSWYGEDPNWGRLYDAFGYSGARFDDAGFSIAYNDIFIVKNGVFCEKSLEIVRDIVKSSSFAITCDLGLGQRDAILYTTDLTEKYVELNKGE